jgi:hypothetical protein
MATKKQKRLAGEERARQRDAIHQAQIAQRQKEANKRKQQRHMEEVAPRRRSTTMGAVKKMRPKEQS